MVNKLSILLILLYILEIIYTFAYYLIYNNVIQIIGTKEFLNKIISLYPMCFSDTKHKDKRHPNSNTYFISCSYAKADMFAKILYDNSNIYLDRKYERFAVLRRNS